MRHTSHEIVLTRAVPRSCTGLFGWKPIVLSITPEPQTYFYYLAAGPSVGAATVADLIESVSSLVESTTTAALSTATSP